MEKDNRIIHGALVRGGRYGVRFRPKRRVNLSKGLKRLLPLVFSINGICLGGTPFFAPKRLASSLTRRGMTHSFRKGC